VRRALALVLLLAAALGASGCVAATTTKEPQITDRPIRVTTSTNFITDAVRRVGGERVEVTGLMGPGVDPHLYKASARDVQALRDADIIFYGGLHLEGKMDDLLHELGARQPTVAVSRAMPRERLLRVAGAEYDPHVWFDPALWRHAIDAVEEELARVDPAHAASFARRADAVRAQLGGLERAGRARFAAIPRRSRVLVTSHDAFRYFGRAFGFDVVAVQGISTAAEATTADLRRVIDVLVARGVKAVFVESSVPRQTIDAVVAGARARGHEVRVGRSLYSDAAGDDGAYLSMFQHNIDAIAEGLR
jgi:manganese/zinc/iron transport system substrate-binding protein